MPRPTSLIPNELTSLAVRAALGQQVLDLVKATGLLRVKRRARRTANGEDQPKRRTKKAADVARATRDLPQRRETVRTEHPRDDD